MPNLLNYTPFSATTFGLLDKSACQFDLIVISATFEAQPGKPVRLADEQMPVRDSDEYYGEPGFSSVRYEGEIALEKPFVDVIVNGRAYAPLGRKAEQVIISLQVGDINKVLLVSGDRQLQSGLLNIMPSLPIPFDTMPIVYERAFGGVDTRSSGLNNHYADSRNPVGVGFHGAISQCSEIKTEAPNIEYFSKSSKKRTEPAGLGIISRNWQPRIRYAGIYDDEWKAQQWPLLPKDFDHRHYQAAPTDQQSATIQGGESVEIFNMTPDGKWKFTLPTLDIPIRLWPPHDRDDAPTLRMDTVLLEPDNYKVILIARAKIPILRNQAPLEEIILGHVSSAWWRARLQGKMYLDWSGKGICNTGVMDFKI